MKTGLKSILVGYHAFWLHPFFVAEAWRCIYGFPLDPRLWVAFFVHDLGYWECEHMDDDKGEQHPFFGAKIMHALFDRDYWSPDYWYDFCLLHSRSLAKAYRSPISKLAYADKLAFLLYPKWLLRVLYFFSGEWEEYRRHCYGVTNDQHAPLPWDEWYHQASLANIKTLKEIGYVCE